MKRTTRRRVTVKTFTCPMCGKPVTNQEPGKPKINGQYVHFPCAVDYIRQTREEKIHEKVNG